MLQMTVVMVVTREHESSKQADHSHVEAADGGKKSRSSSCRQSIIQDRTLNPAPLLLPSSLRLKHNKSAFLARSLRSRHI